jgi:glycosyltransferase involved in cell wall biosynthesis
MFLRFYRLCKQIRPDIIQSWGAMSNIYAIPAAKALKIRLLNSCIANAPAKFEYTNKKHLWTKLSFPFSDLIIGNSQAGLKVYGAPAGKSKRIFNGFDLGRMQNLEAPQKIREKLKIRPGKVVGMVGAFYGRKDYDGFIRAGIQLLEAKREVTFIGIGDGPTLEECRAIIPERFKDRILLPGQIRQVESYIQLFDVGVLSTNARVHGEGISNAIIEYMVLGKPVVATDGGGTPEIIEHGKTGFLVAPQLPTEMAERIAYLLDHPEEARRMGALGKDRILDQFTLSRMTQEYINTYEALLTS